MLFTLNGWKITLPRMNTSPVLSFISGIGGPELLVIFVIILLFFGAKRLPELARGLGKSMKEFKRATQDVQDDFREAMDAADPNKPIKKTDSAHNSSKESPVESSANN